jgi:hypothetical protein
MTDSFFTSTYAEHELHPDFLDSDAARLLEESMRM